MKSRSKPRRVPASVIAICYAHRLKMAFSEIRSLRTELTRLRRENRALAELDPTLRDLNVYIRCALEIKIQDALRDGQAVTVGIIDINDFKGYNDTHGHTRGNKVIRQTVIQAQAGLQGSAESHIARYGGDEFMIAIFGSHEESFATMRKVFNNLRTITVPRDRRRAIVTCSIGYDQSWNGAKCAQLVHSADSAMYVAKQISKTSDRRTVLTMADHSRDTQAKGKGKGSRRVTDEPVDTAFAV